MASPIRAGSRGRQRAGFLAAIIASALLFPPLSAAAPAYINYQGKLGNASGNPLTGVYTFCFNIYATDTGGAALATDNLSGVNTNVTNGLYSVQIGSQTAIPISALQGTQAFLEISIKAGGGACPGTETLAPRERLASAPFAFSSSYVAASGVDLSTVTTALGLKVDAAGDNMTGQLTVRAAVVANSSITVSGAVGVGVVGASGGTLVVQSTSTIAAYPAIAARNNAGTLELLRIQQDGKIGFAVDGSNFGLFKTSYTASAPAGYYSTYAP